MARPNITEITNDQAIARFTDIFFTHVRAVSPAVPANYAGKYVVLTAVVTDTAPSEAQMNALETQIGNINGVERAFCLIGPARLPLDRVPDGSTLHVTVIAGFDIE